MESVKKLNIRGLDWDLHTDWETTIGDVFDDEAEGVICMHHHCIPISVYESMTEEERENLFTLPYESYKKVYRKKKKLKVYKIKKR